METLTLLLFCAALVVCVALNWSILYALAVGLVIFLAYGRRRGYGWRELGSMCLDGVKTARNILVTFLLIGVLTALWRASGTIPAIISYTTPFIQPSVFLLMTFLLNCLVSVLTGTAFGAAATMGVICATLGTAMGVPLVLIGGAVLSGVFFGDRCSPVSTSALLVAELTQTSIFDNIRSMLRTAWLPFVVTSLLYLFVGMVTPHTQTSLDLAALFETEFQLHWIALLPALVIFALALGRVPVKWAMGASILSAIPICLLLQRVQPVELLHCALLGYQAREEAVGAMLNGGGVISMVKVAVIVCISSAYSGIFQKTGLLDGLQQAILTLSRRITRAAVHKLVKKHLSAAGLDSTKYSSHKLRHTAATLMLQNGVDVRTLQEVLGHDHLNTTQIYTHVDNDDLRTAARANPLAKVRKTAKEKKKDES